MDYPRSSDPEKAIAYHALAYHQLAVEYWPFAITNGREEGANDSRLGSQRSRDRTSINA
jgi:hypothetical protein